ncbi:MAG: permease-like cell division protein FtsX [Solirubrobacterales bacterium]
MRIRTIRYFFHEASTSLSRNRILSIATASTVAVCIFILGMAMLIFLNTTQIMTKLESDIEIVAFLDKDLSPYQEAEIQDRLSKMSDVRSIVFVSKDEALADLQSQLGGRGKYQLNATLGDTNPLPNALRIKANDPKTVDKLAERVQAMPGIEKIRYGQEVVKKLFKVTGWIKIISVFTVTFLAVAAVFLVATTIRLTIFSRRKEIYIMKLVGATNWFIRMPFFLEGIFLAVLGTVFAVTMLYFGYYYLLDNVENAMAFIPLVTSQNTLANLYLALLGLGAGIGIAGTFLSVNKYLDV